MDSREIKIIRRAAFDIGSGSTKLQCCDCEVFFDPATARFVCTVIKEIYGIERPVQFGADLMRSSDGALSEEIQERGLRVFLELKAEAERLGATETAAIATEVFRRASNGPSYLDRIRETGIPVTMISQCIEAELGYQSVQCMLRAIPDYRPADCVWDSGGSSFQITRMDGEVESFMGSLGSSVSNYILIKEVQGRPLVPGGSPNPVSKQQVQELISKLTARLSIAPEWLLQKGIVATSAGSNSIFRLCCIVLSDILNSGEESKQISSEPRVSSFSFEHACQALDSCLNCSDEQLLKYASYAHADGPNLIVPKLTLLVSVMKHANIKMIETVHCIGSCVGLMCDDRFW